MRVVFFVLIFLCCMKLSFFNIFFSTFLKLKANGSRLMWASSWLRLILQSNRKNVFPDGMSCRLSEEIFTTNCLSLTFIIILKLKVLPVLCLCCVRVVKKKHAHGVWRRRRQEEVVVVVGSGGGRRHRCQRGQCQGWAGFCEPRREILFRVKTWSSWRRKVQVSVFFVLCLFWSIRSNRLPSFRPSLAVGLSSSKNTGCTGQAPYRVA